MKRKYVFLLAVVFILNSCKKEKELEIDKQENPRKLSGGATTIDQPNSFAFSSPAPNLSGLNLDQHLAGDAAFEQVFVTPPVVVNQGLGPIFNNNSCIACHPKDGRAPHPNNLNGFTGLFIRASILGTGVHGGPNPVPGFGGQIQQNAVLGTQAEAEFSVSYSFTTVTMDDGETVILRKPVYYLTSTYVPLPAQTMLSPRVGPPVFGLGLLEAIPEANIVALSDINDDNRDGISGKPNYVWNEQTNCLELGRFGWKGINPTVLQQCAGAYNDDMGVTNPYFPVESSFGQSNFTDNLLNDPELS